MRRRVAGWFAIFALIVGIGGAGGAAPAQAHVKASTGYSEVRAEADGGVDYRVALEYKMLARAAALEPSQISATTDSARAAVLGRSDGGERVAAYLLDRIRVSLDGAACAGTYTGASVARREGAAYANLSIAFDCPGEGSGRYRIDYDVFSSSDAVVDDHTNLVEYDFGGGPGRVVIDANRKSFEAGHVGYLSTFARFGRLGFEHLVSGLDHVLFLIALLFGATSLRTVLKLASMFTVAHSITLVLATAGFVHIPSAIVEPLIALSIAVVAVDNILGATPSRHRLAAVFVFGLLHGLGFAGALAFTDEISWAMLTSLVGFNTGIELGQALLVVVLFPPLAAARHLRWSAVLQVGTTAVVAAMGLFWFFQRVTFI